MGCLSMRGRGIVVGLAVLFLIPVVAAWSAEPRTKVAVVAFGLDGDQSVFESEAKGAAEVVARRFAAKAVMVRANTRSTTDATAATLAAALDSAAADLDTKNDLLVLILTSHGTHGGLVIKAADGPQDTLWPQTLSAMLDHAGVRHRAVIISACYAGIFIPPLAGPDTLVITAADASHSSFGCQDGAQWTYFGDALFNVAMRRATTLREAFDLARTLVRERELRNGFEPSNPQLAGGENIEQHLTGPALSAPDAPFVAQVTPLPWPVADEPAR
jgi:Peptidase C13 family